MCNPVVGGADRGNPGVLGVGRAGTCSESGGRNGDESDAIGSAISIPGVSTSTVVGRLLLVFSLGRLLVNRRREEVAEGGMPGSGEGECAIVTLMDRIEDSEASGLSIN